MIYTWNIFYDGKYLGQVRAFSESSAIHTAYMKTGGASAYSGRASRLYTAERAN